MLNEQKLDPQPGQFTLFDAKRGQPERLGAGKKHAARMRFEGQHGTRPALCPCEVADPANQHRMSAMQPVEIAHGEHRATGMARSGARMSDDADHRAKRFVSQLRRQDSPMGARWVAARTASSDFGVRRCEG
jgi:hypothetical protein